MAQPEKRENSVLFSLQELRKIEENRVQEEEDAIRTAEENKLRAAQEIEARRRAEEEAKIRAEREAQLEIERAREAAEREVRLRVESAEAAERQRQQAALEQQRLQQEMELRRAEVAKTRPTWMLAVTGIAVVGVVIAVVLSIKFLGQSDEDKEKAAQAEIDRKRADEEREAAKRLQEKAEADAREFAAQVTVLEKRVNDAVATLNAAKTADQREAAARALALAQQQMADAKAARDKAIRAGGISISAECKANPLAKGCLK